MSFQPLIIIYLLISHGGSKPPPYLVVVCTVSFATAFGCLSLTMQLLLFRKNHARLACSVVNALTTACCRYQLLRIADRGKPCPYGIISNLKICAKQRLPRQREPNSSNLIFFFVLAVFFSLFDNVSVNIICKLAVDFELLSEYDK